MSGGRRRARGFHAAMWAQRDVLLALGIGAWLAAFWLTDGWHQHRLFLWVVLPVVLLNLGPMARVGRHTRWLWLVGGLLGWQCLTRLWATGPLGEAGSPGDALAVFVVLTGLVAGGRHHNAGPWTVAGLSILSALVAVFSLSAFYLRGEASFVEDRLRNPLVYEGGLNPILTGMLFGFGALGAAWFSRRQDWRMRRVLWLAGLGALVFALMATQSRAPMLAFGGGFAVLFWFERRRFLPPVLTALGAVALYVLVLYWLRGGEAAEDLVGRGSTGRLAIYRWFLGDLEPFEFLIGSGMGGPSEIPEGELGWFVHHPHSSYLSQLYLTGLVGLVLLGRTLLAAFRIALTEARQQDALWLALLVSGTLAVLFDGAQIFSLASVPRLEFLVVAVPAALAVGRSTHSGIGSVP